jgi:hypothetical protein
MREIKAMKKKEEAREFLSEKNLPPLFFMEEEIHISSTLFAFRLASFIMNLPSSSLFRMKRFCQKLHKYLKIIFT